MSALAWSRQFRSILWRIDSVSSINTAMPDLWSTVIGLVERYWKDKPRKDVIASLVTLRANMISCQHWYKEYAELRKRGDVDEIWWREYQKANKAGLSIGGNPKVEWTRSLVDLGEALVRVDSVLQIFSPEAREEIRKYESVESLEVGALGMLLPAAKDLGQSPGFDLDDGTLEPTFKAAVQKLDLLIKENFKPEEVFAAQPRW